MLAVGIAFWVVALLGLLIIKTFENFKWIFIPFGIWVEVIFTIVEGYFTKKIF